MDKNGRTNRLLSRLAVGLMLAAMALFTGCPNKITVKPETFAVTFSAGEHGTLKAKADGVTETDKSPISVEKGKTVTFTAKPADGYEVEKWTVTGSTFENGSGTVGNTTAKVKITAAVTVKVLFKAKLPAAVAVTGVTLNKSELTLEEGKSEQLTATVLPDNATNKKVSWSSENTEVATVDQDGTVVAKKAGTANIIVTTEDGNKTASCTVTVTLTEYTITYNLNGGTNDSGNPASYTVETETITLKAAAKTGYSFMGWYEKADFTGEKVTQIGKGSTGNKTLWAKWKINEYAVTFSVDGTGGTLKVKSDGIAETTISPINVEHDKTVTFTATTESGYVVDKWTVTPADALQSGGTAGSDTAMVKVSAATTVTVTFKPEGGTPPTPPSGDVGSFEDTGDGFIKINPPAAGITGMDPTYPLPGTGDHWKGVFRAGRKVTLSPYKLGKTEVPYKLWKEVYDWAIQPANGYKFAHAGVKGKDGSGSEEEPVTKVSWRDCIVWCNAYTQKIKGEVECVYRKKDDHTVVLKDATKDSECDDAYADMSKKGFRLPTEAEWEYAARWQNDSTNAEKYGNVWLTKLNSASGAKDKWDTAEMGKVAWYRDNSDNKTHPVGEKRSNALGLHDMSGNVWEWCFDRYDNNPTANDGAYESGGFVTDPQGAPAASGNLRVIRGGSWYHNALGCVVGFRDSFNPDGGDFYLGFRVAMSKN